VSWCDRVRNAYKRSLPGPNQSRSARGRRERAVMVIRDVIVTFGLGHRGEVRFAAAGDRRG